jgi:integrase
VQALQAHQAAQEIERRLAGSRWTDSGLVFVSTIGAPLDPRNVLRLWHKILEDADVPRVSFHALRHTTASLLIAEDVQMKMIQELLGHSQISTTSDIYRHVFPQAFIQAAAAMDRALN